MPVTQKQLKARPAIRVWLFFIAALIFAMVIVGGATRLTESGLSITEWAPLLGAIPPLSEADWLAAFEKYRQIPQYALINKGMSLSEFQYIYWWEWSHRFLGRFIGLAFALPMLFFWLTGRLENRLKPKVLGLFVLGGLQGALGWYMVKSGLVDRVEVSQYRLAAHLLLATLIYGAMIQVALGIGHDRTRITASPSSMALAALILLQIGLGGLVAGLDAGMGYNTWPLMDGAIIPGGLGAMSPAWKNLFENALTVQFDHRMVAYAVFIYAAFLAFRQRSASALAVLAAVTIQTGLGIATLLTKVQIHTALAHQAGALIVLALALWHWRRQLLDQAADRA